VKRRLVKLQQKWLVNPLVRRRAGDAGFRYALLETIGRKSGLPRQTPVGDGGDGDTFWIVAEHGRASDYVRNLEANPRVRVRVDGEWRAGSAHVMAEDDPIKRLTAYHPETAKEVRRFGTSLLTVRVDLDPMS
jgi:deazaflavin-dependent oxidoreductase (nitroreductase family)